MANQQQSRSNLMQKDKELIAKEEREFTQRLAKELAKLENEGIGFYLPIVVVDHIADTESNISFIKSKIKKCAKEGIEQGDGLNLFKVRRTSVKAVEQGQPITKTEIMILVQCEFNDSHKAIYSILNQTVATRQRVGVYVPSKSSLAEVTNKPLQSQSPKRTSQSSKGIASENIQHRAVDYFPNHSSSTRVHTTDESTALPSVNQPLPFKLIPVLPQNKNRWASGASCHQ